MPATPRFLNHDLGIGGNFVETDRVRFRTRLVPRLIGKKRVMRLHRINVIALLFCPLFFGSCTKQFTD